MTKTIAIIYGPELHYGGVEQHLLSLIRNSDRELYQWHVYSSVSKAFKYTLIDAGGTHTDWSPQHVFDLRAARTLQESLQKDCIDLVHIHYPRARLISSFAARKMNIPVAATIHIPAGDFFPGDGVVEGLRKWLYSQVEKSLNRYGTDQVIYVSEKIYGEAVRKGIVSAQNASMIWNGLEPYDGRISHLADIVSQGENKKSNPFRICYAGRLHPQKGLDVFLKALAALPERVDWESWIIGDGTLRLKLELLCKDLGIDDRVRFWGWRDDVRDILNMVDVFMLPSRFEGMPVVLLEAMAAGLPCVVTPVGECDLMIEDGMNGFVVPVGEVEGITKVLEVLFGSVSLRERMGEANKQKVKRYGSSVSMVDKVLSVYTEMLAKEG